MDYISTWTASSSIPGSWGSLQGEEKGTYDYFYTEKQQAGELGEKTPMIHT